MTLTRKDFLMGAGGLALGIPLGGMGAALSRQPGPGAPDTTGRPGPSGEDPAPGHMSYAQAGEDVIVHFFFDHLHRTGTVPEPLAPYAMSYLDIGAYEPILINNTFFFYEHGHRGVLVEPNAVLCERLRAVRPEDVTLEAGIGIEEASEADFFVMSEPSWSTFDKEEAEHQTEVTGGRVVIEEVRRIPLLNVNDVMAEHFGGQAPTFVSIDAEGWHFAILKSIDFERFRPGAICVETLVSGAKHTLPEIPAFMETQGYVQRGGTFVNAIFVDSRLL